MDMTRVGALLRQAQERLTESPSARADVEIFLSEILGRQRAWLRAFPETPVAAEQLQRFETMVARREQGEPVAYIIGQRGFWTLDLAVTADTLIPRPDTELLVETALELAADTAPAVLDLGTGSGAIALALAAERPAWQLTAVDRSVGALQVARLNGDNNRLKNVQFLQSDWFSALPEQRFGIIVSNPPYVAEGDVHLGQGDVRFEPRTALTSGADGLDDIRHIVAQAPEHLEPQGWLAFEHGYDQGAACRDILIQRGFTRVETRRDLGGHERVSLGQWSC